MSGYIPKWRGGCADFFKSAVAPANYIIILTKKAYQFNKSLNSEERVKETAKKGKRKGEI
jgi:hypothetical protein